MTIHFKSDFFFGGGGSGGGWGGVTNSLILSRVNLKVVPKRGIPEKNHLTTCKQNLACLTCDPSWAWTHSGEIMSDLDR